MDRGDRRGHDPAMASLLLAGGRVIDPGSQTDAVADVLVVDGVIAAISRPAVPTAPPSSPGPAGGRQPTSRPSTAPAWWWRRA